MINFLKIASGITATEYQRLLKSTPYSRLKVKALALTVFIPTLMWSMFGFLLSYGVLHHHWLPSMLLGLLLGTIVFTLERLIVMGNGNKVMFGFRVLLGVTIAWLGAQLVDLVIFKDDIDNKLPMVKRELASSAMKQARQQFEATHNFEHLKTQIASLDTLQRQQQQAALDESGGLRGTGIRGVAAATRFKQEVALQTRQKLEAEQQKLEQLQMLAAVEDSAAYRTFYNKISDNSLLLRIKAMEKLLEGESAMRQIYWGFTLFMFLLEFLVIIFKATMKKSAYELEVDAIEALYHNRTQRMYGAQSPYNQPHVPVPLSSTMHRLLPGSLNTLL